eukprot:scaffold5533_cov129-Isochrysis_galbana.AAC.2
MGTGGRPSAGSGLRYQGRQGHSICAARSLRCSRPSRGMPKSEGGSDMGLSSLPPRITTNSGCCSERTESGEKSSFGPISCTATGCTAGQPVNRSLPAGCRLKPRTRRGPLAASQTQRYLACERSRRDFATRREYRLAIFRCGRG